MIAAVDTNAVPAPAGSGSTPSAAPVQVPAWTGAVLVIATTKALLSMGAWFVGGGAPHPIPAPVFLVITGFFATAGLYLVAMGRRDPRAVPLGAFFVLVASSFSERLLETVAHGAPAVAPLAMTVRRIPVDAFLAYFLWRFVREFPRRATARAGVAGPMLAASLASGTALLLANVSARFAPGAVAPIARVLAVVDAEGMLYWGVVFGLMLPALVYARVRSRDASADERRRVALLLMGLVAGFGPMVVAVLLAVLPPVRHLLEHPTGLRAVGLVVYPPLLSIPVTTGYAVLVHQALDVRLLVRRAIQYAMARYTLLGLATIPFAGLALVLYTRREERLEDLVWGPTGAVLAGTLVLGVAAFHARAPLLAQLDRRFFREQYDAQRLLAGLVDRARSIRDPQELAVVLAAEVDRALHVCAADMLLLDPAAGALSSPGCAVPPLALSTQLARRLEVEGVPLDAVPSRAGAWQSVLPPSERRWVEETRARLLVPVSASDGSLLGLLVLGEKRSELPFTREDRQLLTTIAASVALSLEHRMPAALTNGAAAGYADPAARECTGCGRVHAAGTHVCPECGGRTADAPVPLVLSGKFRSLERLGVGGTGVVYRAVDLALDREVAIKTLPRMDPRQARALRREARVMAAVSHPSLAQIFGAESWSGAPLLVVEYLAGGTLADHLSRGPLELDEALGVVEALVPALSRLHQTGVLHRDIKPSNIGYTADGNVKLLDFGIARVVEAARQEEPHRPRRRVVRAGAAVGASGLSEAGEWIGTPLYLSPEVVRGAPPDPSVDLWALCMVLYESLLGRHPLDGLKSGRLLLRLYDGDVPDPRTFPQLAPAVQAFLADALHRERGRRPASAAELGRRLGVLRVGLAAASTGSAPLAPSTGSLPGR